MDTNPMHSERQLKLDRWKEITVHPKRAILLGGTRILICHSVKLRSGDPITNSIASLSDGKPVIIVPMRPADAQRPEYPALIDVSVLTALADYAAVPEHVRDLDFIEVNTAVRLACATNDGEFAECLMQAAIARYRDEIKRFRKLTLTVETEQSNAVSFVMQQ